MIRPRIYAAHPMTCYDTDHEQSCLNALMDQFSDAKVVNPAERYRTNAGWRRAWPRLLPTLEALVVFGDEEGMVGIGCLVEVTDAIGIRLPVATLDENHQLRELAGFDLLPAQSRSARRVAWLVAGQPVESEFPCAVRLDSGGDAYESIAP